MQVRFFGLAVMCAMLLVVPASAHHSHNNYDIATWTPFEGTVKQVYWLLPHSWVYLEVKDAKGVATMWALEAASPNSILENGVKKEDVRPGDSIRVRCHLLRDGTAGCLLGFVTPQHGDMARGHGIEREWD